MRLAEIASPRRYRDKTQHDVLADFVKAGGIVHGGSAGLVLEHPRWPYVVKVFEYDPPYLRYVRWAKRNQSLTAVPRILAGPRRIIPFYARPVGSPAYLYIVKLEKLAPVPKALGQELCRFIDAFDVLETSKTPQAQAGIAQYHAAMAAAEHAKTVPGAQGYAARRAARRALDAVVEWRFMADAEQRWAEYPGLKALTIAYAKLCIDTVQGTPDLHSENIMQRPDGSYVLTDPLWIGETVYQAHDRANAAELDLADDDPPPPDQYNTIPGGKLRAKKRPKPVPLPDEGESPF